MKIQRQLSKKRGNKKYYRYVINISSELIEKSDFKKGDEVEGEAKKGEIKLKKK